MRWRRCETRRRRRPGPCACARQPFAAGRPFGFAVVFANGLPARSRGVFAWQMPEGMCAVQTSALLRPVGRADCQRRYRRRRRRSHTARQRRGFEECCRRGRHKSNAIPHASYPWVRRAAMEGECGGVFEKADHGAYGEGGHRAAGQGRADATNSVKPDGGAARWKGNAGAFLKRQIMDAYGEGGHRAAGQGRAGATNSVKPDGDAPRWKGE